MQETPHHGDRWFKEAVEQAGGREHIARVLADLRRQTATAGTPLGETGTFPQGAMTPDDEGELRLAVTAQGGKVILAFGKAVQWIGMSPREARQMAKTLTEWADKA